MSRLLECNIQINSQGTSHLVDNESSITMRIAHVSGDKKEKSSNHYHFLLTKETGEVFLNSGKSDSQKTRDKSNAPQVDHDNFDELRKQKKQADLKVLEKIYELLNGDGFAENPVYEVAKLCGGKNGISFNDKNDKENYFIRNRYGFKKRNLGREENEDKKARIDFEIIYRLKALIESGVELPNFESDIKTIKDKLEYIFFKEKEDSDTDEGCVSLEFKSKPQGNESDLESMKNFVKNEYPSLVVYRLKEAAKKLKTLEFNDRESIYIFARIMVVVGELFHDVSDLFPEHKKQKRRDLFSLHNILNDARNRFIHFNLHMSILNILKSNKNIDIKKSLKSISENFSIVLCGTDGFFTDIESEKVENAYKCFKGALLDLFSITSPNKKETLKRNLTGILFKVTRLFEVLKSPQYVALKGMLDQYKNKFEGRLETIINRSLSDENPGYLIELANEKNRTAMPKGLDADELFKLLDELKRSLVQSFINDLREQTSELLNSREIQLLILDLFDGKVIPELDLDSLDFQNKAVISCQVNNVLKTIRNDPCRNKFKKIEDALNTVFGKLKNPPAKISSLVNLRRDFAAQLDKANTLEKEEAEEINQEYDFELSTSNESRIVEITKEKNLVFRRKDHLSVISKMIHLEMEYLKEVEKNAAPSDKKYITEHIVTLIGQYISDIQEKKLSSEFFYSLTLSQAGSGASSMRSKGLAHEIFGFDSSDFDINLYEHIIPAKSDFEAVYYLKEFEGYSDLPKSSYIYAKLGWAYSRLGMFKDSSEFYLLALEEQRKEIPADELNENSISGRTFLENMGITGSTAVFLDVYKVMFGVSLYEIQITRNLMLSYVHQNSWKDVLNIAKSFMGKLNIEKLMEYQEILCKESNHLREKGERVRSNFDTDGGKKAIEFYQPIMRVLDIMSQIERPYVINFGDKDLFVLISEIFSTVAKACMQDNKLDRAEKYYSRSMDLLYGSNQTIGEKIHIDNVFSMTKLMDCFLNLSEYYVRQERLVLAENFANEVLSHGELGAKLGAYFIHYQVARKKHELKMTEKIEFDLKEYEETVKKNQTELKRIYGDKSYYYLERFYITQCDSFAVNHDYKGLESVLLKLDESTKDVLGLSAFKVYNELLVNVIASCCSSLHKNLTKEIYVKGLEFSKKYFNILEKSNSPNELFLNAAQKLAVSISNYAEWYLVSDDDCNIDEEIKLLQEALMLQERYKTDSNITKLLLFYTYNNKGEKLLQSGEWLSAKESILKSISFLKDIHYESPTFRDKVDFHQNHITSYQLLIKILRNLSMNDLIVRYDDQIIKHSEKTKKIICVHYSVNLYERDGFFSPSKHASSKQPYGPYSDWCCCSDDPATEEALQHSQVMSKSPRFKI